MYCAGHGDLRDLVYGTDISPWRTRLFRSLVGAGITTPEQVDAATDEQLLAIPKVAQRSVQHLRAQLAARRDPKPEPTAAERLAAAIEAELRRYGEPGGLP